VCRVFILKVTEGHLGGEAEEEEWGGGGEWEEEKEEEAETRVTEECQAPYGARSTCAKRAATRTDLG
jgi:hypothetical protein